MKKFILKMLAFMFVILGIYTVESCAAISASSKTVNSGDTVSISVTSNVPVISYKVTMTDSGGLNFKTSSGGTGEGTATITDAKATGMKSLATYTFTAPNVSSDTTYTVKFSASAMEDEDLNEVQNSSTTATVTVKAPINNSGSDENTGSSSTKSSNANLKNLVVSPVDFSGFKSNKTEGYSVTVPNNVTSVKIKATPQHSGAKVSVSGDKNLDEGNNVVKITVTAEDGTQKVYKVVVNRKSAETDVIPNKIDEQQQENENTEEENQETVKLGLAKLEIEGLKLNPEFKQDVYRYELILNDLSVNSLKINAVPTIEGATVEILGNENLKDGENIITIIVKSSNSEDLATYQVIVKKQLDEVIGATDENDDENLKERRRIAITITVLATLTAIAGIVFAIIEYRYGKKNRNSASTFDIRPDFKEEDKLDNQDNMTVNSTKTRGKHF